MITIYELVKTMTTSKERYPKRKTETLQMGLYSSIERAEEAMAEDVKTCKEAEPQEENANSSSESVPCEAVKKDEPEFHHFVTMPKYRGYHLVEDDTTHLYGIVKWGGDDFEMLLPCVINTFTKPCNEVIYFTSGSRQGLWHLHYGVIVPPVYDDIEFIKLGEPILFTKDGVKGYVDFNNNFVPKSEVDAIEDEDERHDRLLEFLCEDSDY